jgi:transcriptional regulator with XRE-family HTH domain
MTKQQFGDRLRHLWKSTAYTRALSQKELANKLALSQPMLSQMLSGEKLPSHEKAIEIAIFFNVCTEYLLSGRGPKHPGAAAEDVLDLSQLDSKSKAVMRAMLDSLTKPHAANNH